MPIRTREHEVGDLAVAGVIYTLVRAGHAIQEISKDYGEDLMVQTSYAGHMDASRLWFQVKGTENISRHRTSKKSPKERFSLQVPFDTAVRWIRTVDLVVVVLWDVEAEAGWYAVPRRQVDDWEGTVSGKKFTTLHFGKALETEPRPFTKDEFTPESAARLAWESRFEHFRLLVLSALDAGAGGRQSRPEEADSRKLTLLMNEFLRLFELTDRDHPEPGEIMVKAEIRARAAELYGAMIHGELVEEVPDDPVEQLMMVAGLVILERLEEIDPLLGMPAMLFEHASRALVGVLGLAKKF